MPTPVSVTISATRASTSRVSIVSVPPVGIASRAVDRQVEHDLLDLRAVGEHRGKAGRGQHRDLDVLADQPPQHRQQRGGDLAEVERMRVEHLLAGEGEQLAGELGGALGRALDLEQLVAARAGADPPPRDLAVPADHRQQVVEVVRDAARELADRLHLLRLPELVLEPAALGDVAQHEQVAAGDELGLRADLEHAPVAVLLAVPDVLEHALGDALGFQEARPVGLGALRADQVVEPRTQQLLARAAVEPAGRIVDELEAALGIEHGDNVHRRVEDRLQLIMNARHSLEP